MIASDNPNSLDVCVCPGRAIARPQFIVVYSTSFDVVENLSCEMKQL